MYIKNKPYSYDRSLLQGYLKEEKEQTNKKPTTKKIHISKQNREEAQWRDNLTLYTTALQLIRYFLLSNEKR